MTTNRTNRTNTYQRGSLEIRQSKEGPCWYLRFRQEAGEGKESRPRLRIGLVKDLPTKKLAFRASEHLRKEFNSTAQVVASPRRFHEVVDRYMREEMPERYSTARGYKNLLVNHIAPRWGEHKLGEVRASDIRDWLRSLDLSPKTRGHVRDMLRTLFRFAMLWEWLPIGENPMSLFRLERSGRRTKLPRVLTIPEFLQLVDVVGKGGSGQREHYTTMLMVMACLGLRSSELFGLQWRDIDSKAMTIHVRRSVVAGRVDKVKTEHSSKPLPLNEAVATLLKAHWRRSEFKEEDDWIFASPHTAGEKTYHAQRIQQYVIAPAARKLGLGSGIGWHTLRHSYRAWLDKGGAPIGVQRDLLRHADISTTMNVYGGSFVDSLRDANAGVVKQVIQ